MTCLVSRASMWTSKCYFLSVSSRVYLAKSAPKFLVTFSNAEIFYFNLSICSSNFGKSSSLDNRWSMFCILTFTLRGRLELAEDGGGVKCDTEIVFRWPVDFPDDSVSCGKNIVFTILICSLIMVISSFNCSLKMCYVFCCSRIALFSIKISANC